MSAENYVYKKEVDWSLFNYGLNIPIQHQRGESKPITLYLNGRSYKARLNNLKIDAKYGNHQRHFGIEITETVAFQAQSDWVIRQRKDDQWGRITRNGMDLRWQVNGI